LIISDGLPKFCQNLTRKHSAGLRADTVFVSEPCRKKHGFFVEFYKPITYKITYRKAVLKFARLSYFEAKTIRKLVEVAGVEPQCLA
jgi:hypothetical protein